MEVEHLTDERLPDQPISLTVERETSTERLDIPAGGGAADTPYPDYDVARKDKWALDWDDKTKRLIHDRLENVPPYRFFDAKEVAILEALIARVMPQEDRVPEQRIPIGAWIDERLDRGEGAGYRYETMPDDRTAYRLALNGVEQAAFILHNAAFVDLSHADQAALIQQFADGTIPGSAWTDIPAQTFFQQFMGEVITNYYAHPAAWAEIGFNGPASPRGHIRVWLGGRDPWEAQEKHPRSSVEIVRRHLHKAGSRKAQGGPTH
jgi:hypothetical protein